MRKILLLGLIICTACNKQTLTAEAMRSCRNICEVEQVECVADASSYGMTNYDCSLLKDDCTKECGNEVEY
jgi:hypothetical protein